MAQEQRAREAEQLAREEEQDREAAAAAQQREREEAERRQREEQEDRARADREREQAAEMDRERERERAGYEGLQYDDGTAQAGQNGAADTGGGRELGAWEPDGPVTTGWGSESPPVRIGPQLCESHSNC